MQAEEAVIESIQQDDALLTPTRNHGELSFVHPVQDLSGPLGKVGGGNDGSRHRTPGLNVPQPGGGGSNSWLHTSKRNASLAPRAELMTLTPWSRGIMRMKPPPY
jgi:hypothetical protein